MTRLSKVPWNPNRGFLNAAGAISVLFALVLAALCWGAQTGPGAVDMRTMPAPTVVPYLVVPDGIKAIVKRDKIVLTEKIQFAFDDALIDSASYPALDAVVVALQDNPGLRVEIGGYASSEGMETHNQGLSERRAKAVLDYLVSHGIAANRLGSEGFSSSQPLQSNLTASGREANRRVEFDVWFVIVGKGDIPSPHARGPSSNGDEQP